MQNRIHPLIRVILYGGLVLLGACNMNDTHFLTGETKLFWDIYKGGKNHGSLEFHKNGACYYYTCRGGDCTDRNRPYIDDVIFDETWSYSADTIYVRGFPREILYQARDTLMLRNPVTKQQEILIKSRFQ